MKLESLEELRVFVQIVESGSLTAAARALGIPSSTVSRRLAALESRLNTQLLYRNTRSMSLSETGRMLLIRSQHVLDEVAAIETALQQESVSLSGMVRVSVPSILAAELMVVLKPLMTANAHLQVQIHVNDRTVNPVTEGLDVVLMGGKLSDSALIARRLIMVETGLMASREYLAAHGTPKTPADLAGHTFVRFISETPQTELKLTGPDGTAHVVPIGGQLFIGTGRSMVDAVSADMGIGHTSPRMLRTNPRLQRVLPEYRVFRFPLYAIYPASRKRSARVQAVVDLLQEKLQQLEGGE